MKKLKRMIERSFSLRMSLYILVMAASVITSSENVCPRFQPAELGLDVQVEN